MGMVVQSTINGAIIIQACFVIWGAASAPPLFIFGDSLVDAGNNFYITTIAKANFPNGIDFGKPFGIPSGRFTNGRTVVDMIGQAIGLDAFTPPFLSPAATGNAVLKGVNYASGASGILNETEWFLGFQIHLDAQISDFAKSRAEIVSKVGEPQGRKLLNEGIFIVAAGSNDLLFARPFVNFDAFIAGAISRLRTQLIRLYAMDARKIVVASSPPIGCLPFEKFIHSSEELCVASSNRKAEDYNKRLKVLLSELSRAFQGSVFVYADVYLMLNEILQNYASYGFEEVRFGCCRISLHGVTKLAPCGSFSSVCRDRSKFLFWDEFHLTERGYSIIAEKMMLGGVEYMSPINIEQLLNI